MGLWTPKKIDMEEARGPSAAGSGSAYSQERIRVRSSWPERSEGHERSPAGAYSCVPSPHTCIRSPAGEQATVKCVSVYVCMCVCVQESSREFEKDRERDREKDRETDIIDRQKETERDRERQREIKR